MNKMTAMIIMMGLMTPLALGGTLKIYPTGDAYVRDSSSTNFGSLADLRVGQEVKLTETWNDKSYLKFDLSNLSGKNINAVVLSIRADAYNPVSGYPGVELYSTSTNWQEGTINWNNKPTINTTLIDSKTIDTLSNFINFNIPLSYLTGNEASFVLIENSNNLATFYSKDYNTGSESYVRWPHLLVIYDGASCNTAADSDCDGHVSFTELVSYATKWKTGQASFVDLINAANAWKLG